MIVVDASAVVEVLLRTPLGERIANELLGSDDGLHAPYVLDAEVGHAIRKAWIRAEIDATRGDRALRDLFALPIVRHEHELIAARAWELRHLVTFYDGLYLALAEGLGAPFLTCDRRLALGGGSSAAILLR